MILCSNQRPQHQPSFLCRTLDQALGRDPLELPEALTARCGLLKETPARLAEFPATVRSQNSRCLHLPATLTTSYITGRMGIFGSLSASAIRLAAFLLPASLLNTICRPLTAVLMVLHLLSLDSAEFSSPNEARIRSAASRIFPRLTKQPSRIPSMNFRFPRQARFPESSRSARAPAMCGSQKPALIRLAGLRK